MGIPGWLTQLSICLRLASQSQGLGIESRIRLPALLPALFPKEASLYLSPSLWDWKTRNPIKDCFFAPFPASVLARTCAPPYRRLIEQIMHVLLVKGKELMISLESSSTLGEI